MSRTLWFCDDEEQEFEELELLEEARTQVDEKYPRGEVQVEYLKRHVWNSPGRTEIWRAAHQRSFELKMDFEARLLDENNDKIL